MLKKYLIAETATVRDAAAAINDNKTGFALVIDLEGKLVGTVTDGDLRRAFLAGRNLDAPVSTIMCSRPIVAAVGISSEAVAELAKRHRIQFVPLLDGQGCPVEVVRLGTGATSAPGMFKTAIIMAGGEGRRLRPLTENTPKPMLLVDGRPLLEHIVRNLVDAGLQRIYLSVNYKAEVITDYFGNGRKFGIAIDYLQEKEKLGTAGGLSLLPAIPDEPVLVMNGDVMTSVNYSSLFAFHVKHRGVVTVAAMEYKVNVPFGTLEIANQFLLGIVEKPDVRFHCNAGVYALDPEALQYIPVNRAYDMTTLMTDLVHNGLPVNVFPIHEYWMDIGRAEDLEMARAGINANPDRPGP